MNWLYRFMYGRYGADQLTFALIILYLILSLTLTLIPVPLIWLLAYIPMVFCFYRMLSRNKLRGPLFCCSFYGLCLSETVIFKFILFQIG